MLIYYAQPHLPRCAGDVYVAQPNHYYKYLET